MATTDIGALEVRTTPQAWEDNLDAELTEVEIGQCLGEEFTAGTSFDGHTCAADKYYHLTAKSGNEHDGRSNAVSAAGNARVHITSANTYPFLLMDEYVRISWMEVRETSAARRPLIYLLSVGACDIQIHHNIIYSEHTSPLAGQLGIQVNDADCVAKVYRNIIYGVDEDGAALASAAVGCAFLHNTIYNCNHVDTAGRGGIACTDADWEIKCNASFDNSTGGNGKDIVDATGTLDYNATSDTTGDDEGANGIADLTTADQFTNPTTTWADCDLTIKAGADLIDEGTSFSADTYPEINVAITKGATRATISGTWDIGADEYAAAGGGNPYYYYQQAG